MKKSLKEAYVVNEQEKNGQYNDRILNVEHGYFTTLVFSCLGGISHACTMFFKHLTNLIADKRNESYQNVPKWIKTKISFALLKVALICLRGYRGKLKDKASVSDENVSGRLNLKSSTYNSSKQGPYFDYIYIYFVKCSRNQGHV